ncbi:hypothetical protein ACHHYP_01347 [Achlya hypogyna]|uniref:Uncharacterized protein n=1 Tax=Achlya hypogyna TaxID=1202772 RepID=A0A1V9ZTE3_ACHHY|nr:hypothetical protein ACHHYP_01347 [Achlya hypogyna]
MTSGIFVLVRERRAGARDVREGPARLKHARGDRAHGHGYRHLVRARLEIHVGALSDKVLLAKVDQVLDTEHIGHLELEALLIQRWFNGREAVAVDTAKVDFEEAFHAFLKRPRLKNIDDTQVVVRGSDDRVGHAHARARQGLAFLGQVPLSLRRHLMHDGLERSFDIRRLLVAAGFHFRHLGIDRELDVVHPHEQ